MSLLSGARRLPNRKRATPAKRSGEPVSPAILPANLPTPVFGHDAELEKFSEIAPEETRGIPVSRKEKEIMSIKSLKERRKLPELEVADISYTIASTEELEKMAIFEVKNENDSGLYSVNDPRGGTVDRDVSCITCQKDSLECPGHLGIIKLNEPIIHPEFRRIVVDILTSVCGSCGGLLLSLDIIKEKKVLELEGSKRLRKIAELSEKLPCRHRSKEAEEEIIPCVPNPTYKTTRIKETGKIFYTKDAKAKGVDNIRSVEEIEEIFNSISPEDAEILGFSGESHPSRFIMRTLAVIPLCARPPVFQDGEIMQDDLTSMYQDIVRCNNELAKDLKEAERENKIYGANGLIFKIEHLINNSDQRYRQGKKKAYQSLKDRIQGKDALIRGALMGKRVDFSARTVIGPDPSLKFGQIRVPRVMAPFLTHPVVVNPENISKLTSLLRSGKVTHIIPSTGRMEGRRFKVNEKNQKEYTLTIGDVVDRWLMDGDPIVFNRQPTLHKQGIMGYETILGDGLTIGVHLGYTKQHNADFDGDESALHAPQSEDAQREVAGLMSVACNIMNAQNNTNIAGVVFDALTGSYILSLPETTVDPEVFMNTVSFMTNDSSFPTLYERLDKYHVPRNSGRAYLSLLFPPDFYYSKEDTRITEGILISGTLSSSNIGSAQGTIIQALYKDYGQQRTVDFLTDIYWAAGNFLDSYGFSVGMDDCFLTGKDPQKTIEYEVQRAKMLVKSMGPKLLDPLEEERREEQIRAYLNTVKNLGAKISKENLKEDNSFNVMAKSGAKGSTYNIAQITGILGQQFVQGQRLPQTLSGKTRSLPYFPEGDLDPSSRGFIANSFLTGLTPSEFFFHMAAGREGLVNTAITTGDTGHIHHKIVKSMEDIKVVNDGSVRNASGVIFQFAYSDDGFDAAMLESVGTKTGKFASFINLKRAAGRINAKYGALKGISELDKKYKRYLIVSELEKMTSKYENPYELHNILERYLITSYPELFTTEAFVKMKEELKEKNFLVDEIANKVQRIVVSNPALSGKREVGYLDLGDKVALTYGVFRFEIPKYRYEILSKKGSLEDMVKSALDLKNLMPGSQQWAIPLSEYQKYVREGATIEGFASAFNSQIIRVNPNLTFCSLFESDKVFGSIGNFFEVDFFGKEVVVNPPFIESILEKAAKKCLETKKGKFIFYGPAWKDASFYKLLERSEYKTKQETLSKGSYFYENLMTGEMIPAKFDSVVFVLEL